MIHCPLIWHFNIIKLNKSTAKFLTSLKILILSNKIQGHEVLGRHPLLGVLLQYRNNKILELFRYLLVRWEFYLICYYLHEILLLTYIKRRNT